MGGLISRFRKKPSTFEVLESIDKDIKNLLRFRQQNLELQKKFVGKLMLYSILLYIISGIVFYFYFFPQGWQDQLLYSSPLLIFPILVWLIRKFLHWYFVKRIAKNDLALNDLKEKKKKILEDVMETETYKKAREILEKFDPDRFKQLEGKPKILEEEHSNLEAPATPKPKTPGSEIRQRINASMARQSAQKPPGQQYIPRPGTPYPKGATPGVRSAMPRPQMTPHMPRSATGMQPRQLMTPLLGTPYGAAPGPPLPRRVPPRDRTKVDRVLEYLLGDGPQNKYALICRACSSHNGMALQEEFEYVSFRCCYCFYMNPSRKQRPSAPKLDIPTRATPMAKTGPRTSQAGIEEEDTEESDTESDEDTQPPAVEKGKMGGNSNSNNSAEIEEQANTQEMQVSSTSTHDSETLSTEGVEHSEGHTSDAKGDNTAQYKPEELSDLDDFDHVNVSEEENEDPPMANSKEQTT